LDPGKKGRITITIDIDAGQSSGPVQAPPAPPPDQGAKEPVEVVPPEQSATVFVDITAYNSRHYYVLGDVQVPGKLPWVGNETVLDAIQYAGGLMPSAEPRDIRLVRPGRGGRPARIHKVSLEAIQERGDLTANYQLFPGDRLIIGRNDVVKKTAEIDRLQDPIQRITTSIQEDVNLLKSLGLVGPDEGGKLLGELVEFWAKQVSRKGELELDEQALRGLLLHRLKPTPAPKAKK
jgi:hypothetical protein